MPDLLFGRGYLVRQEYQRFDKDDAVHLVGAVIYCISFRYVDYPAILHLVDYFTFVPFSCIFLIAIYRDFRGGVANVTGT